MGFPNNVALEEYFEFSDEEVLSAFPSDRESEDHEEEYQQNSALQRTQVAPLRYLKDAVLDSGSENSRVPSEDDDPGGWGPSKKDYYNANVIETEADAQEEEAEARKLQQKYLQGMTEADFGLDEEGLLEDGKEAQWNQEHKGEEQNGVVSEVLPQQEITDAMGPDERMSILRTRYPEFEPLGEELLNLQSLHEDLGLAAASATVPRNASQLSHNSSEAKLPIAVIKHGALSAYLAALTMYFALLTSQKPALDYKSKPLSLNELRDHPIMDTLVQLRELWGKVKGLPIPDAPVVEAASVETQESAKDNTVDMMSTVKGITAKPKSGKRTSKAERTAARAQAEAHARHLKYLQETEASLASLSDLTKVGSRPAKIAPGAAEKEDDSDFGDPLYIAAHEAAQKEARKKSLKFYTSQIASKSQNRGVAGRDAGGDADIPYKERLRDRQERLSTQAEKRGKKNKPSEEEALGRTSDEEDTKAAREIRDDEGKDYYDLIANNSSAKKAEKARIAAEQVAAAGPLVRVPDEEMDGEDSKRAISYSMKVNKGLHAKRKKEVRNPRVKKRKKFEEKKKRLGSLRPVFKGGEGKGYQGELTGIKRNLVRSVKL